ncbi:MAG: SprB repeat-containing protein [Bacteroidetes bacterium]|nr:SprB repeat-containing protein [Bacteroidota bacterium]
MLNPSCVPGNDGSITIVATGGTPAYQYSIGGANQASNVFLNVAAGNYTITATDINGCSVTSVVSIAAPNSPFITSLLATDVLCNGGTDGTITATASGGLGALNYNLQPGNQNNANGQFTNLGAGVYTITVGDANGCTVSNTIAIVEPSLLNWTVNIITNVNCNGGNDGDITIGAAGGTGIITYTLQPNNITNNTGLFPNLIAGVYTMTSSDINGCTLVTTLQVTQGALLSWSTAVATNVTCNGGADGSITTSTTGGNAPINYNLQPGNQNNAIGTFTNLTAGVYTVLATDANGCSISTTLTITEPPILQITNVTTTAPSCVPGNDGSITIVATGGTPAYQYSIGGANQASNVFLNVAAGNYTITATDINGCSATSVVSIAAPNSPFITSLLATDVLCNGGTDGTITATASGGLGALNYNLQPGNQNNANGQFTNLGAGVYTITVGDANGCTVSNTIAIVEPSLLNWTVNIITNVNCNGGNDGDITIGATGGTGIITYTLQPNNITNNTGLFPNLIAGVYTMTATDVNGCTLVTTLQVTQGALLSWSTAVATNVTCNGGADGSITTSTTGGNAPINYNLQPGNQNNAIGTFTNLAAGVYTVLATDANGCSISTTLAITEPPILQITNVSTTAPSCVPGNDGSITIVATGGTPAYQYSIGGANQASNVFLNVAAGNYTITATDINGCSVTSVVSIAAPNSPFITSLLATDVLCNGGTDGTITATASGGLGALNYNLQPGNQNNANGQFTNLGAGVYTITVGDANGCTVSSTIAIVEPSLLNWTVNIITNVNCNGGNDGDITIGAAGGTGIISYTLQPNNITNNTGLFPNLIAGVYTMTATDINGCTLVTTLQVTQGALLSWSTAVATNVTCNGGADGSITTSTTGGNAPINYNLQPGNQNNAIGTFTNLAAGVYTVLATDANGCSISTTLTITEPPILQITNVTTTAPSCVPGNDGSVTIVATGGTPAYQYSIGGANQASNVFLNVADGNYTITATDINGCSVTSVVSIAAPNSPVITSLLATDVLCNGGTDGTITATASGGLGALNYNLQPGNQNNANGQFTNLGAGVYTITVGDANGCTVSSTIAIVEPSLLNWTVNIITNVNCNGGNDGDITIGATGGTGIITYTLQPNNITNNTGLFPNLIAGVYTMTATDVNGCTLVTTLQVTQGALLSWSTAVATNVTCNGGADGSITTSTTGGNAPITYNLQPGNQNNVIGTFTNLAAGVYTVLATDANGCSISTTLTITEPPILQITNVTTTAPSCVPGNDGSVTIVATGGTPAYQYSIGGANQASNVFLNVAAGNYTITATDINGCSATSVVSIAAPNSPVITSLLATDVLCNGGTDGTITATASGGLGALNYNLQPGNQNNANGQFTNLGAGVYTITVGDANGCTVSSTIAIVEPSLLNWTVNIITNVNCNGGNDGDITIGAAGGTGIITYTLQPNNITNNTGLFPNLIAGVYTMTATDINGCTLVTTLQVTQGALLSWSTAVATNVTCNGGADGSITTSTTGGNAPINYNLQPGNQNNAIGTFTNLAAGVYTVLATDANGCSISTTLTITEPPILQITNVTTTAPSCVPGNDGSVTIVATGGTPAYQYSIGGANQASNVFLNVAAGNYTITVTDINGCSATSMVSIAAPNAPTITSALTTDAACNPANTGTVTITAVGGTGIYNYSADGINFQLSNIITGLTAGTYTITVVDAIGCTTTSAIHIGNTPSPIITSILVTDATCVPGCDGTATLFAAGGNAIYTFSVDNINFQASNLFNSLCTNVYTATVVDGNGCTNTSTFSISTANAPVLTINSTIDVLCNGGNNGALSVTAVGAGLITYLLQPIGLSNITGLFNNLPAFNYTIVATDANGCSSSTMVMISEPPVLQFTNLVNNAPLCSGGNNGTLDVSTTGGTGIVTYTINPFANFVPPATFNNLIGNTTYTVTATDANGCSITSSVFIGQPQAIVITNASSTDATCFGGTDGSISVQASGGTGILNYSILPNAQNNVTGIFNNVNANIYTVTVTDANNCTATTIVAVAEPSQIVLNTLTAANISCNNLNNGTIDINCSGGTGILSYNLLPVNITNLTGSFTNLLGGIYTIIVTDANGCTYNTTTSIINPTPLVIDSINSSNVLCSGGNTGLSLFMQVVEPVF